MSLFRTKSLDAIMRDTEQEGTALKRVLGPGDLIMLAIGAVIGAGIFSSIGTAAAGEVLPSGEIVRYGAGPALILSFILLKGTAPAGTTELPTQSEVLNTIKYVATNPQAK